MPDGSTGDLLVSKALIPRPSFKYIFGIVVSMSNCHPRGPGFGTRLYSRNFSGSIGSGTGSTQPREDS